MNGLILGLGVLATVAPVGAVVLFRTERRAAFRRRLDLLRAGPAPERGDQFDGLAEFGIRIARSGLISAKTREELESTLANAGFRGSRGLGLFLGTKLLLMLVFPCLAFLALPHGLAGTMRAGAIGVAGLAGMLAPDFYVRQRRKAKLRALDRGLPDALDLMVICAQAGLGLEASLERVSEEIGFACTEVAEELRTTSAELRVGNDRRAALMAMGDRTGLDSLRRFAATLVQTMQYGTPLSQVLRVLSAEMRQDTLTRFEERAARLPVLLTMPMILFILPCVFVVVGGPAGLRIASMFHHG